MAPRDISSSPNRLRLAQARLTTIILVLCFLLSSRTYAGERLIIQLKDFEDTELKAGGFTLPSDMRIHINALGGSFEKAMEFKWGEMYAYGWIIDANTRKLVWSMDRENTTREKDDRKFDGDVSLNKGSYEVYFVAYGFASNSPFASFNFNIDRRKKDLWITWSKRGPFSWLDDLFGGKPDKDWRRRSKRWGIELSVPEGNPSQRVELSTINLFEPPREFPNVLYKATRLGENEHIKQAFTLKKPIPVRVYALGEMAGDEPDDYGWIVDRTSHKRIWEMRSGNIQPAGGGDKDVKFDEVLALPAGEYVLYYITDGSHSFVDWNNAPPDDPYNYGITLMATSDADKSAIALSSVDVDKNVIIQLTRIGDDELRSANFSLKADTRIHIYALGERGNSRRQMVDHGWIINAKTREKVWTMDYERTEHAGGADKNRMIDEVITLPRGTYTAFYQTDDSHAYNDWNTTPPFDPENWGITISGEGKEFDMSTVETNVSTKGADIIAQIVAVGNDAKRIQSFSLDKPTRIRIYALGEGQNREMYDYGWIEDGKTGHIIWEMTYLMTFHAGGGRKNRMVNTTLMLDKGQYKLHYASDDSHSYNHWNTDPPDDPTMWGITLYREE